MNTNMLTITLQEIKSDIDDLIDIIGKKTGTEFLEDDFTFHTCSLLIGEIAEQTKNIPDDFKNLHPEVHWNELAALDVFTKKTPSLGAVAAGVAAGAGASSDAEKASGEEEAAAAYDRRSDPKTALLINGIRLHIPTIYNCIVRFFSADAH